VGKAASTFAGHAELVGALGVATALRELQEVPGGPRIWVGVSKTAGRRRGGKKSTPERHVDGGEGKRARWGAPAGKGLHFDFSGLQLLFCW
jgi:hypothetical protein